MARWRSPTSWKRTWQRARAKFCTGSDGTLYALPKLDASVSTPIMQPPLPPPMMDKGAGKGVVPPPPMMPPSTLAHAVPTMPWGPLGQTMPMHTAPTCSSMTPEPATTCRQDGPAQQELNRLFKEMKKEEDNLPPHLQSIAHEMQKQDEKNSIKTLSQAVRALGDAKQDLLEAESQGSTAFAVEADLQQSVVKWREFSASFHASERAHQQGVMAAKQAVKPAQKTFDIASKKEQSGKEGTVSPFRTTRPTRTQWTM